MNKLAGAVLFGVLLVPIASSAQSTCPTLTIGSTGSSVTALQTFLHKAYTEFPSPTGYFGPLTQAALKQWQGEHGIEKAGILGPKTRAAMGLSCATNSSAATVTQPTAQSSTAALIQTLLAQLKILQAKLAALLAGSTTVPDLTYTWQTGGWSTCTNATQSRTASCISSQNATVADSYCATSRPITSQSCNVTTTQLCIFNNQSVAHGSSVMAYQAATVPPGSQCVSQQRICTNGTLSGSYVNTSCTVAPPIVQACGTIDSSMITHEIGNNYIASVNAGPLPDTTTKPTQSTVVLFENGKALGPAHSLHADIRTLGVGRFSNWNNSIYFSTSDNTDPRTNGRTYTYGGECRTLKQLELVKLSSTAPGYATFQSHDQKMVTNSQGAFLVFFSKKTYIVPNTGGGQSGEWQLMRSQDGGKTFQTVYTGGHACGVPTLETDGGDNLYLIANDCSVNTAAGATFYSFSSANGYIAPAATTSIPFGDAGKYTSYYDASRRQLYYFTWDRNKSAVGGNFWTLDLNGNILRQTALVEESPPYPGTAIISIEYPHLAMVGSRLIAAWTSARTAKGFEAGIVSYEGIQFMISDDGGISWKHLNGAPITLPVVVDAVSGPSAADQVVTPDEFLTSSNWLSNALAKGGMLHMFYYAQGGPWAEHYVRFNMAQATRDYFTSVFRGNMMSIQNLDGFFTTKDETATSRLYVVSAGWLDSDNGKVTTQKRIIVLASDDNGATWFDYAYSPLFDMPYAITGSRLLSSGGAQPYIQGMFTDVGHAPDPSVDPYGNANDVWYFRVPAE